MCYHGILQQLFDTQFYTMSVHLKTIASTSRSRPSNWSLKSWDSGSRYTFITLFVSSTQVSTNSGPSSMMQWVKLYHSEVWINMYQVFVVTDPTHHAIQLFCCCCELIFTCSCSLGIHFQTFVNTWSQYNGKNLAWSSCILFQMIFHTIITTWYSCCYRLQNAFLTEVCQHLVSLLR